MENLNGLKKRNGLDLMFIVDKSITMAGVETRIAGHIKKLLTDQSLRGRNDIIASVIPFDNVCSPNTVNPSLLYKTAKDFPLLDYVADGSKALNDAIMTGIIKENEFKEKIKAHPHSRADVLYTIISSGRDNASTICKEAKDVQAYTVPEQAKNKTGDMGLRNFIFFGTPDFDAEVTAQEFTLEDTKVAQIFPKNEDGVTAMFSSIEDAIEDIYKSGHLGPNWKAYSDKKILGSSTKNIGEVAEQRNLRILLRNVYSKIDEVEVLGNKEGLSGDWMHKRGQVKVILDQLPKLCEKYQKDAGKYITALVDEIIADKKKHYMATKVMAARNTIAKNEGTATEALAILGETGNAELAAELRKQMAYTNRSFNWLDQSNKDQVRREEKPIGDPKVREALERINATQRETYTLIAQKYNLPLLGGEQTRELDAILDKD